MSNLYNLELPWKPYKINLSRMYKLFKDNISKFDGLIADESKLIIVCFETPNTWELDFITDYWNSVTENSEVELTSSELLDLEKSKIRDYIKFGHELWVNFVAENNFLDLDHDPRHKLVYDYIAPISNLWKLGLLELSISELEVLISDPVLNLEPYVTVSRLREYKEMLENYLSD